MDANEDPIARVLPLSEFIRFQTDEIEQSIATRFENQVRRVPERVAVKTPEDELTYAQLNRLGNQIAAAILKTGGKSAAVAILVEQSATLIGTIIGVLKAGRGYVGLDPAHAPDTLRQILVHCGADILITNTRHHALANRLAGPGARVVNVDSLDKNNSPENPDIVRSPEDVAYIYYTSGTTGVPKGVVDTQRNVLHNVMRYTNHLRISERDRLTLLQSVAFSGAVSSLFCALLNGATCYPIDLRELGIDKLAAWLIEQKVTMYHSVPSIFQRVVEAGKYFPSLRVIRLEGDQMSHAHLKLFQSHFGAETTLVNGLGATETGISHQFPVRHDTLILGSTVPVGFATADMEGMILDEDGAILPPDCIGEIAIKSRYLATGYWQQPELTAVKFLAGPDGRVERIYRTGDLGRRSAEGCLELLGRVDKTLKLHGNWIDVTAIEVALTRIAAVREAAAVVRETPTGEPQLIGYVVPQKNVMPSSGELQRALLAQQPQVPVPSRFVFLAALPLDANGKVKRLALPAPDWNQHAVDTEFARPTTATEQVLARIWCQVLKRDRIGIHDNFAELGGDSLRAIEIALHVEQQLCVKVPPSMLLEAPNVAEMAWRLERPNVGRESMVAIQPAGTRRPLFLMHDYFGDPVCYGVLAKLLGPEQPVYGLRMRGLNGQDPLPTSIEEMASHYLAEIQKVQPNGPYLLGGDCVGGVIAFELAQQMKKVGEEISLLAMMDTRWLDKRIRTRLHWHLEVLSGKSIGEKIRYVKTQFGRVLERIWGKRLSSEAGKNAEPDVANLSPHGIVEFIGALEQKYKAKRYRGEVVVMVVGAVRNQLAYLKMRRENIRLVTLPLVNKDDTHILHPQYVKALAHELRKLLLAADA